MATVTSRQLSPSEHELAKKVPPELVTIYLEKCGVDVGLATSPEVFGEWRCFRAYRGAFPMTSWMDARIMLKTNTIDITMPSGREDSFRIAIEEDSHTMDIFVGGHCSRGIYELHDSGQILVACRNERPDAARPSRPPAELPPPAEVLRSLM